MRSSFHEDPYPGRPKILFIGVAESSHVHAWIDLLEHARLNVRLFALPSGVPPATWPVRTYVTASTSVRMDPHTRERLYAASPLQRYPKRGVARFLLGDLALEQRYLADVIRRWRPDIVHTMGLDPAAGFYHDVRESFGLGDIGRWVLQTRGGADLALSRFDPAAVDRIGRLLRSCDQLLSDNQQNFEIALGMGVSPERISRIGTVPGTGGIDVERMQASALGPPSTRSLILWPKAYESRWSKALPVFEALTMCVDQLPPCEILMLAMNEEARLWFRALPERVRDLCTTDERIPRSELLTRMGRARVMLAPSLVDGTPNSLFEAMAAGAFPIVSPLESIRPLVDHGRTTLFARNLHPQEIAAALVRSMSDDGLVDDAVAPNLETVLERADRIRIAPRVVELYESLAAERGPGRN